MPKEQVGWAFCSCFLFLLSSMMWVYWVAVLGPGHLSGEAGQGGDGCAGGLSGEGGLSVADEVTNSNTPRRCFPLQPNFPLPAAAGHHGQGAEDAARRV